LAGKSGRYERNQEVSRFIASQRVSGSASQPSHRRGYLSFRHLHQAVNQASDLFALRQKWLRYFPLQKAQFRSELHLGLQLVERTPRLAKKHCEASVRTPSVSFGDVARY
jgi:hypothetical protein